eukprot:gene8548-33979_t
MFSPRFLEVAVELFDAYGTTDISGTDRGISRSDFVDICQHSRSLATNKGILSPEHATAVFQLARQHLLSQVYRRLNFRDFVVALRAVVVEASMSLEEFVLCYEAGHTAIFSTLGSNAESDSTPYDIVADFAEDLVRTQPRTPQKSSNAPRPYRCSSYRSAVLPSIDEECSSMDEIVPEWFSQSDW